MDIATKVDALCEIYEIYKTSSQRFTVACKRGCATCCTQNVTLTTLEGYHILRSLMAKRKVDLLEALRSKAQGDRLQPSLSTNALAALCLRGEDPPEEDMGSSHRTCPFLLSSECLIYEERPFGCRCFFSTQVCNAETFAVMDPFLVTVNTVFLQFIEHFDLGGLYGNLTDILLFLESETCRSNYETGMTIDKADPPAGLTPNRTMPALLVPPEHEQDLQPMLMALRKIETECQSFEKRLNGQRGIGV
jgi:Fe-S-cluster containining protein